MFNDVSKSSKFNVGRGLNPFNKDACTWFYQTINVNSNEKNNTTKNIVLK